MSESTDAGKTYTKVEEPQGDTSIAIVEEAMRLGPGASNPDIAQAVEENHDIDTSPSWVSRVRNKHLEVETGEESDDAEPDEDDGTEAEDTDEPDQSGVDDFDPEADVDIPGGDDGADALEDRPVGLADIVEEVVDQYAERVEADVDSLESNVAELRRSVEKLVDVLERDSYPTNLSDYPEDVQRELRADALEAELNDLRGG